MRTLFEDIVRRATRQVLREATEPEMEMDYRKDFINWALERADRSRWGGPVNAVQLMHEYYNEDNDDALYRLYEAYGDDIGIDLTDDSPESNWICEEIRKAINEFGYYNFNTDEDEEEEEMNW